MIPARPSDSAAPAQQLWAATARLSWQALAARSEDRFLEDIRDHRHAELIAAPAPIRAALMTGFDRLCDLDLLLESCKPRHADLLTVPLAHLEPALITVARSMTLPEIDHVSRADQGYQADCHRDALVSLLASPHIAYPPGDYCFPAEVVELVAHVPTSPGHIPCMAIVLLDAVRDGDRRGNAAFRIQNQWACLENLPQRAKGAVFAAFRYPYESGPCWSANLPDAFTLPWVENIGPPPAKSGLGAR